MGPTAPAMSTLNLPAKERTISVVLTANALGGNGRGGDMLLLGNSTASCEGLALAGSTARKESLPNRVESFLPKMGIVTQIS